MRGLGTILMAGLLLCGSGCAYFQSNPPLATAKAKTFVNRDLPVPEGFKLDKTRSLRHQRDGYRRLFLTYRQTEYLGESEVADFFKRTFANAGWGLAFVTGMHETKMVFEKGNEEARITVKERFAERSTWITLEIEPRRTRRESVAASASKQNPKRD